MQINLKQTEITEALRQYIGQKGIDLAGKTVDISFIAGRKEGGLTAEINIEDQDIPGFSTGGDEPVQLSLVPAGIVAAIDSAADALAQTETGESPVVELESPAEQKTVSLFS